MTRNQIATMYCHDPTCTMFGTPQEFRFVPTSWDGPSEWIDEPECRECFGSCHEAYPDVFDTLEDALEEVPQDPVDWTEVDREFVVAAATFLRAKNPQVGGTA